MKNIGPLDRFLRGLLGAGLIAWALNGHSLGWFGLILMSTAMVEVCPLYSLFGVSSYMEGIRDV